MAKFLLDDGLVLSCSDSYAGASDEVRDSICNGCGAADSKFDFVPDTVYGLYIGDACNIHDWDYWEGRVHEDKLLADRRMLNNAIRIIEARSRWNWLKKLRCSRARKYYLAVDAFGGPAFWAGNE